MSRSHHNSTQPRAGQVLVRDAPSGLTDPDASAHLVHELANLLDGSLRNVGLAITRLQRAAPGEELMGNLSAANQAMQQMAELMRRWMQHAREPGELYAQTGSLAEAVDRAVRLVEPEAARRGVRIVSTLDAGAAALRAGPIYPAILNALRNSLEALGEVGEGGADGAAGESGRVELSAWVEGEVLVLCVADTGPGLDPAAVDAAGRMPPGRTTKGGGHGLGLLLIRQIAVGLAGSVMLTDRVPCGAVLTLRCPVGSLGADLVI